MRSLIVIAGLSAAVASAPAPARAAGDIITTHHQVTVRGKVLAYTARAGTIPIRDNETGDVHANMFFIAYTLDTAPGQPLRPLTFLWNGGPGANSGLVHLLGFGPKRVTRAAPGTPLLSPAGTALVANDGGWLDRTDMVFIDPIGTGYSRPVKPEYAAEFFDPRGDAESVAEFIRVYRTRYDVASAPLFLAGESYGVWRAALVAAALERRHTTVNGVIMLSLALPLGGMTPAMRAALELPSYTAAAWYHKRLAPDLQADLATALRASEAWALDGYAPALAKIDTLSDTQRDSVVTQVARFTGIPVSAIDRKTLTIQMETFAELLLATEQRVVGHYDTRMTGAVDSTQVIYDPTTDPSLKDILDGTSVVRYMRNELGYRSDIYYQGPFGGGYPPPTAFRGDWMYVKWSRVAAAKAARDSAAGHPDSTFSFAEQATRALRAAMKADPKLRVMIASGRYDLACDYFANEVAVRMLPAGLAERVSAHTYDGGHALYVDRAVRMQMKSDVARFIGGAAFPSSQAAAPRPARVIEPEMAVTHHTITVNGMPLRYTARAGLLPILNNDAAEPHARVFFVAYTLDRAAGAPTRPVTFLWNGGPGANALLLHLVGFGPRRIDVGDDPAQSPRAPRLVDNDATWLTATDLVFVDPVGTGFSRPTKSEYAAEFYGTKGDIASIAEFVRVYRTRFDLLATPVYLAGESYGVWRAAGVADLMEQRGQRVAGVMLISGGAAMGAAVPSAVRTALWVPSRVATAHYHRRLPADLQRDLTASMREAEAWALAEYAPALARCDSLSDTDRERIVAQLAHYTAVDPDSIDRKSMTLTSPRFRALLLAGQNATLVRYDMRLVGRPGEHYSAALATRYLRDELEFSTDLAYQSDEQGFATPSDSGGSPGERWEWDQGTVLPGTPGPAAVPPPPGVSGSGDGPPGGSQPWLRRAMERDPALRAFVAAGLYDSLNSCADNAYLVANVAPWGSRITAKCYSGGHMMYDIKSVRRQLQRDVAAFIRSTS